MNRPVFFLVCCALASNAANLTAQQIDLSLNLLFNNPANALSGGTWELAAKSDGAGIAGLDVLLTGTSTQLAAGPVGQVNGSQAAGFSLFQAISGVGGATEIILGQVPLDSGQLGGGEQNVFYGVGVLPIGSPDYADKPLGSNSFPPLFTTLTGVTNVPWATGDSLDDPLWATSAVLATGQFAAGLTPDFFVGPNGAANGQVWTSLGSSTELGNLSTQNDTVLTTIVRDNFGILIGDYNTNGKVDAADYVVWRDTLGNPAAPPGSGADGNGNGTIDPADYDLWKLNFTPMPGAASGASFAVPEPSSGALILMAAVCCGWVRSRSFFPCLPGDWR